MYVHFCYFSSHSLCDERYGGDTRCWLIVRVSWDRLDIPEITSYVVYYSRQSAIEESLSVNVSSSEKSVIIDDLMTGVEYQFQVVAEAQLINGEILVGERSERTTVLTTSAQLSNKS